MKTPRDKSEVEALRQKAEELLKLRTSEIVPQLSDIETLRLIYELEVHQNELKSQNEELRHAWALAEVANDKYFGLFDMAPSGYFTLSGNGEIIEINLNGAKMLGRERVYLIGKTLASFVSADTKPTFHLFLEKVFNINGNHTCEVTWLSQGGSSKYVHLSGAASENGKQCLITAIDITEQKKAEQALRTSNEFNHSLLQTIPFGMNIVDESGNILFLNKQLKQQFGEEALGKKCWELYRDDQQQCFNCPLHEGVTIDETKTHEVSDVLGGKSFEIHHTGIIFNGQKAMLEAFIDITGRKQSEYELIISKDHALESDRLKSAFLANMSHEIRTPMNGILGFATLLREQDLTGDEQQKYIRIIEKSGKRMLHILNDIIDISKIESGQMDVSVSKINLNEKIESFYHFFKPEVEGKGLQFFYQNSLPAKESEITTDSIKFDAILDNLLFNAIKYTDEGSIGFGYTLVGTPTAAPVKTPCDAFLKFFVKDTGSGIPKDRQEAIFERFIQADVRDPRAVQGAGLGLSISRAYVEMLGGKIWVESEPGKGSVFYFTIPYNKSAHSQGRIDNTITPAGGLIQNKNLKILVAEDDEISEIFIAKVIHKISREVIRVRTGAEAVETCRQHPDIDLVLMDIQMPDINGHEATRQIRQFNKEVVIIAQTAYGLTGDREKAIKAGCNDYISKPISKEELLQLIQRYFNKLEARLISPQET